MQKQMRFIVLCACLCVFSFSLPVPGAEGPVISEFMASNVSTVRDEDGDYTDWIELYNPTEAAINLEGYYLTDDPQQLEKWPFPAVSLPAGQFLLVFASDKNRRDPDYQLHANFKLLSTGEYLALVAPDGVTPVSEFTAFPTQVENVSYGYTQDSSEFEMIGPQGEIKWFIPTNSSLDSAWYQRSFGEPGWSTGELGIGYEGGNGYDPLINTDVADTMRNNTTSAFIRAHFNIDDPATVGSLRLKIKYDDGFAAYINGERLAGRNDPVNLAWNSEATSLHDDAEAVVFEEITLYNAAQHLVTGDNVLAIHGLNDNIGSSDFLIDLELHGLWSGPMDLSETVFLTVPTPGGPNSSGAGSVSGMPEFSHESGTFTSGFSLALSCEHPQGQIRYTLNWDVPDEDSTLYTGPISVSRDVMVRARVYEPGAIPGPVMTRAFTMLSSSVQSFSSNLPIIVVNTYGSGIGSSGYTGGFASFYNLGDFGGRCYLNEGPETTSIIGLKYRGSSSSGFPKKMFAMETWDERGNDHDVPLLGLPSESDWVLYAPYSDKSLMRNHLSYGWSNAMGQYAPRTRLVELYHNTGTAALSNSHYQGVYVLVEKIKRNRERVDIEKLLPSHDQEPEIAGGYILKIDRLDPGDSGLTTTRGTQVCYVDPKEDEITIPQRNWLRNYLNAFETALYSPDFSDPFLGYAQYIDVDSWVDCFLIVELMKNIDGYRLSTFFYKDRNGKLVMGPAWDYNLSLGNADYLEGWLPNGWYLPLVNWSWWMRLFYECPEFEQKVIDRWADLRRDAFDESVMMARINSVANQLSESAARNFDRWDILGQRVWPNWYIANTYNQEITWMKGWLSDRIEWIDSLYLAAPVFSQNGGPIADEFELTITAPEGGTIYYTTNGSDPRLQGGNISPTSRRYQAPVALSANTLVRARALQGGNWSGLTQATFVKDPLTLLITEIMYHPAAPAPDSPYEDNDFEFLELYNYGNATQDLSRVRFTDGIDYVFPQGLSLASKHRIVLARNPVAFASRYDTAGITVVGGYVGLLENLGETITLEGSVGEPILDFVYDDYWYPETDGLGHSLVPVDPDNPQLDWSHSTSWRASMSVHGSPGMVDDEVSGGWQLPGDANQDGRLDLSDAISILGILFDDSGKFDYPCGGASFEDFGNSQVLDINLDDAFDLADAVNLLGYLFSDGPAPLGGTNCIRVEGCSSVCIP